MNEKMKWLQHLQQNRIIELGKRDTFAEIQLCIKETAIVGLHQVKKSWTIPGLMVSCYSGSFNV